MTTPLVCLAHSTAHYAECELLKAESVVSIDSGFSRTS